MSVPPRVLALASVIFTFGLVTGTLHAGQTADRTASSLPATLERAGAALAAGRRTEAALLYAAAADKHGSVQALLHLARIRSGDGDADGAIDALGRARTLAPNSEEVLAAFAQVSLATRRLIPALTTLDALTRMCPTVASHHYLFGVALMQAGDMISSVEALRRAEQLEPDRPLTLIALGMVLNHRKMFTEAAQVLGRALEFEPDNVEAIAARGESEEGLGQIESAEAHARRALSLVPGHATGNLVLGLVLLRAGKYEAARDALQRAAVADPISPKPEYQLSLAYARMGDDASSQKHRELYAQKLREMEARQQQLRSQGALPASGGMRP